MIFRIDVLRNRAAKDERLRPRHHAGTGFIQVYLKRNQRLHILHPEFPPTREDSGIHNHRFSFRSEILLGCLVNTTYGLRFGDDHEVYEVYCGAKGSTEFKVVDPVLTGTCTVDRLAVQPLSSGDTYVCEVGEFHTSTSPTITATRMTKLWECHDNSRVVVPKGTPMRSAFDDQPAEEKLWPVIEHVIDMIRESGRGQQDGI